MREGDTKSPSWRLASTCSSPRLAIGQCKLVLNLHDKNYTVCTSIVQVGSLQTVTKVNLKTYNVILFKTKIYKFDNNGIFFFFFAIANLHVQHGS